AAAEGIDLLDGPVHSVRIVGVDIDFARIVLGDVDLGSGRLRYAADRLAAGADEKADLFRVDLDRLDAGGILREARTRGGKRGEHLLQDLHAGVVSLVDRDLGDFKGKAVDFQVELEAGDPLGCAGQFEVHVAEVVLLAENVGDRDPF